LEALPLSDISAKSFVLIQGWIALYGVPAGITSDRGSQFTSTLWDSLCNTLGIKHMQTAAYHPQSNGLVERFHLRLKDALHARLASPTWTAHLPWVLMDLHAVPHKEDNISPAQAVFSTPIALPGQFMDSFTNVNEPEFFLFNFVMNLVLPISCYKAQQCMGSRCAGRAAGRPAVCPCGPGTPRRPRAALGAAV
jgi:hypothetical protein